MEKILDGDLVVRGRRRNPNRLGLLRCASVHTQDAVAELWIAIVRRMKNGSVEPIFPLMPLRHEERQLSTRPPSRSPSIICYDVCI